MSTRGLAIRMSFVGLAIVLLGIGARKLWDKMPLRVLYALRSIRRRRSPVGKPGPRQVHERNISDGAPGARRSESNISDGESTPGPKDQHDIAEQFRLSDTGEISSQYKIGAARRRWFRYIVLGLIAVSVAAGVTFLIIRLMREATPTTGSIHVVSVPAGADVSFDGTLLSERTPVTIDVVPVRTRHKIVVSLRHYQPYTEEVAIPRTGGTAQVITQLTSQTGKIVINTTPSGAQVWINGQPRGTTPTTLSGIDIDATLSIDLLHKDFGKYAIPLVWDAYGTAYVDYKFSH